MNLTKIGPNMTEIRIKDMAVLFSYQTPVAVKYEKSPRYHRAYVTDKRWSSTTSKHVKSWLDMTEGALDICGTKPQEFFDSLLAEVK